jgi:hypothetical protein
LVELPFDQARLPICQLVGQPCEIAVDQLAQDRA